MSANGATAKASSLRGDARDGDNDYQDGMCAIVLAALFGPRVGIVLLWLFTDRMTRAYETGVVPVVGFFFLPWTTFLYGLVQGGGGPVGAFGIIIIVIGVIADLLTLTGAFGSRRRT